MHDQSQKEEKARLALESKVKEHAKIAIYYREQQDKKLVEVRDLAVCATQRALEAQTKVRELEQQNKQQKTQIHALAGMVMRLKDSVMLLKAQAAPYKQ